MRGGDVFIHHGDEDDHLWVVISDPEADATAFVVTVSLTTYHSYKDPSCILGPKDYPQFIKHPTCVYYEDTRPISLSVLRSHLAKGRIIKQPPVTPQVLKKIRDGAAKSKRIATGCREILREQGLIE